MAGYHKHPKSRAGSAQEKGSNRNAAPAVCIGEPFHNPYTFIPFPESVKRFLPTPLTIDEHPDERHRKSGVLELEITTLSPLMTCNPRHVSEKDGHKTYNALSIGNDIIVPATGVRGALRTLMTVISGGTLGYMDDNLWLTQGRDAQLGPSTKMPRVPDNPFLAEVIRPGSETRSGMIRLGRTKLIPANSLRRSIPDLDRKRPTTGKKPLTYTDDAGDVWQVKLSGRPIMRKAKKEGLFIGNGPAIELPEHFWTDYQGRHRHAIREELRQGDLVWLEPFRTDCQKITCEADIKSIQWARWGRRGVSFKHTLPQAVLPDSLKNDGRVDMVTDLFGQIPNPKIKGAAGPFAARVRPGNLVFFDAKEKVKRETLAPLAPPHPGCIAFYRDWEDLDTIDKRAPLKGYKVYRNTRERGDQAPWKYAVQGVYKEKGSLKLPAQQRVNKTAELLDESVTGRLRIAFRALRMDELALVFAACSVDWKLGGGKPLGLGHCRVTAIRMIDEDGNITTPMEVPENGGNLKLFSNDNEYVAHLEKRIDLYRASQVPVDRLRYPRAVTKNKNKSFKAGYSWFARHAAPKKTGAGLETIWTRAALKKKAGSTQIRAQSLPNLDPGDQHADLLYGYDMVELDVDPSNRNQRMVGRMEPFQPEVHAGAEERAGENISQSRESRKADRAERDSDS